MWYISSKKELQKTPTSTRMPGLRASAFLVPFPPRPPPPALLFRSPSHNHHDATRTAAARAPTPIVHKSSKLPSSRCNIAQRAPPFVKMPLCTLAAALLFIHQPHGLAGAYTAVRVVRLSAIVPHSSARLFTGSVSNKNPSHQHRGGGRVSYSPLSLTYSRSLYPPVACCSFKVPNGCALLDPQ